MNKKPILAALLLLLAAAVSCETYEKVPENSPFAVEASVTVSGPSASVVLHVTDGVSVGDCTLEADVRDAGGAAPDYRTLLNGSATVGPQDLWQFDDDGFARFTLEGLPKGTYDATFTVRRWYHSATAGTSFTIK